MGCQICNNLCHHICWSICFEASAVEMCGNCLETSLSYVGKHLILGWNRQIQFVAYFVYCKVGCWRLSLILDQRQHLKKSLLLPQASSFHLLLHQGTKLFVRYLAEP